MLNYTYLASKTDIDSFQPNDLQKYRYIALVESGKYGDSISETEKALVYTGLARFMHEDCLIASMTDLEAANNNSCLKPLFTIFHKPEQAEAYVAIATIFPDVNKSVFLTPAYKEIPVESYRSDRYPVYAALNHCLAALKSELYYVSLNDIPIPNYTSKPMACPFGKQIKELRKKIGSVNKTCQQRFPATDGNGTFQLGRTTLSDAEKNKPISVEKLMEIATAFNVQPSEISFAQVIPIPQRLWELKSWIVGDQNEMAKVFDIPTGHFFELIDGADIIPATTMHFIYYRYRNLLEKKLHHLKFKLTFENLIDLPATEALAEKES